MPLSTTPIREKREAVERIAGWLSHSSLLAAVDSCAVGQIAGQSVALYVPAQAEIFNTGTRPCGFYLVVFGSIALYLEGADGAEKLSEIVGPGECFGEVAFLLDQPYPVSSRALSDSLVIKVAAEPVHDLLATSPSFSRQLLASMAQRVQRLMQDIQGFAFKSAGGRLADYLLTLPRSPGSQAIRIPITKGALASKLLLAPETLSRLLKGWVACGAISMHGRSLEIIDEAYLLAQSTASH